jgi:hypothetical protein
MRQRMSNENVSLAVWVALLLAATVLGGPQ